ncbi:hypothetical protein HNP84_003485 [Thermocatellispora tengchongensis]|uniref:Uncharacterized protein n=1 Tax=Thermocatellispora tengchongensis TaxID=1073253 RepID=A0A840P438_9ACTN|nr:hypothetical protein [Thermocatellispora tengchongensis]
MRVVDGVLEPPEVEWPGSGVTMTNPLGIPATHPLWM